MKLKFLLLALALAFVARAFAQVEAADEGEDDVEIATEGVEGAAPAGGAPGGTLDAEQQQRQQEQQQQVIQHILANVGPQCREELMGILQSPPEEQAKMQLSEPCRGEVQAAVGELQKSQGGAEGGAAGGPASAASAPAAPKEPAWPVIAQVLGFVGALILAVVGFAAHRKSSEDAFLRAHPEVARKREEKRARDARSARKLSKKGVSTPLE